MLCKKFPVVQALRATGHTANELAGESWIQNLKRYIYYTFCQKAGECRQARWCCARSRLAYFWAQQIHPPSMKERVCPQGAHRTAQGALAAVRLTRRIKCSNWQASTESLWHSEPHWSFGLVRTNTQSSASHMAKKCDSKTLVHNVQEREVVRPLWIH